MSPVEELIAEYLHDLPTPGLPDWPMRPADCDRIVDLLRPHSSVLEFGAGGSTIAVAWARKRCPTIAHTLTETEPRWEAHVRAWLARHGLPAPARGHTIEGETTFDWTARARRECLAIVDSGPDFYSRSLVLTRLLHLRPRPAIVVDDWQLFCRPTMEALGAVAWDRAGYLEGVK